MPEKTKPKRPAQPSPFKQVPESPRIDPRFRGIVITAPSRVPRLAGLPVHGTVLLPEKDFDPGVRVLDAVALIVTRPPSGGPFSGQGTFHYAWMPFRERVVLDDDITRTAGCVLGYFNLALPKEIPPFDSGQFFLLASVGPYVSEILTIGVG